MFLLRSSALVIAVVAIAVASASANTKQEQQMVNLINEIDQQESFPLFGGLSVERVEGGGRSFGGADASEDLAERAVRYLNTHSVNFNVPEEDSEGRQMEGENDRRTRKSCDRKVMGHCTVKM